MKAIFLLNYIFQVFVGKVAESFGLSLLTLDIMPLLPSYMVVIVVNGIFIFPAFSNSIRIIKNGLRNNKVGGGIYISAVGFGILGIVLLFASHISWNKWSNFHCLKISLCLAFLSFAWCPCFLTTECVLNQISIRAKSSSSDVEYNIHIIDEETDPHIDDDYCSSKNNRHKDKDTLCDMTSHLKLRFLTSIIQIVLLPACFFLITTQYKLISISSLYEGFINLDVAHSTFLTFSLCALTGVSSYILACMACFMRLHFAFVLPVILSTPITLFILMTADLCYIIFDNDPPECVTDISPIMIYSLSAGLCLYIGQVCSSTHTFIAKQSYGLTQKHEVTFLFYWKYLT